MKHPDELVSEWVSAPGREVWLIDETKVDRRALPGRRIASIVDSFRTRRCDYQLLEL
jgi:hypothetical protein